MIYRYVLLRRALPIKIRPPRQGLDEVPVYEAFGSHERSTLVVSVGLVDDFFFDGVLR